MKLFDDMTRDDEGPASYSEPKFSYLNRSARPAFCAIRTVLEDWFSRYPEAHRNDLCGRFRSSDDRQHRSALFELFLHELLLRLGCLVEIHPSVVGTCKSPDFLVQSKTGGPFYLEAVVASGESRQEASTGAISRRLRDILDRLDSPNFFIGWKVRGSTQKPPAARKIKAFLKQRLAPLDPERVAGDLKSGGFNALPRWTYSHEGWLIEFFPIPKSTGLRGKPGVRSIGCELEAGWVDARTSLRDAILEKAGKYGKLEYPFVVAVNSLAWHLDKTDVMEALFGKEHFLFTQTPSGISGPVPRRAPDGVWTSPEGPRYTRLSAVLLFEGLFPWSLSHCPVCLYHNPWAEKTLQSELDRLPKAVPIPGDPLKWLEGDRLHSVFDLPADWPGKD